IEAVGEHDTGVCPCCGNKSRSVIGLVHEDGQRVALYKVHWTIDHVPEHGAHWDIVIGDWGDGTGPEDRCNVRLEYRITDKGPGFMIVDAQTALRDMNNLSANPLRRDEVIGTELADIVFRVCDVVYLQDERVKPLAV